MAVRARPNGYGDIDLNGVNQYASPVLPESLNGFPDGDIPPAKKHNTLLRQHGGWAAHLNATAMRSTTLLSGNSRLTSQAFAYATGAGLSKSIVGDSAYIIGGHYVDLPVTRLALANLTPKTFTASKWTHFYVAADGDIIVDEQNIGVAPAPPGGYVKLGTVKTNATDVTAFDSADAAFATRSGTSLLRLQVPNLKVVETVDGTALQVDAVSSIAPVVYVTNTGNATRFQADLGATSGTGYGCSVDAAGTAASYTLGAASTGDGLLVTTVSGAAGRAIVVNNDSLPARTAEFNTLQAGATEGVVMTSNRGVALTLDAQGPLACPLVMVPSDNPSAVAGKTWISVTDDTINFYDDNVIRKRVWATREGMVRGSAYTAANVNNFAGAQVLASFNMDIVSGRTYRVTAVAGLGRHTGSTRDASISCTIGGVAVAFSGEVFSLFQAGAAGQIERKFVGQCFFTAGATGNLACVFQVTPVNGAGNLNASQRGLIIDGAFD